MKKTFQRIQLLVVQISIHCLFWGDACWIFRPQTNKTEDNMAEYTNFLGGRFTSGDSLMLLGSGMGMFMIDEQSPSYPREKTFNILEGLSLSLQSSPTSPATIQVCPNPLNKVKTRCDRCMNHLKIYTRNALTRCFFESHHSWSFQYCTADSCSDFRLCNVSCDQQERRGGFSTFGVYRFEHCKCPVSIDSRPKGALFASQALSKVEQVMEHINETDEPVTWRD